MDQPIEISMGEFQRNHQNISSQYWTFTDFIKDYRLLIERLEKVSKENNENEKHL